MASNLTYNIIGNDKSGSKAIEGVDKKLGGVSSSLKKVAGLMAGAFAVGKVVAYTKEAIKAAEADATITARLETAAKVSGLFGDQVDGVTDRLVKMADEQARATGIDDDAIVATQAKLMAFHNLSKTADETGGAFDRATQAALDMSAAGLGSAESNALKLGKALNDPIQGISALSRVGVTFTDEQKKMIKAMVEAGDVAGAQDFILKQLEGRFGGTAAATANASDRMKVGFSQIQEAVGGLFLPAMDASANVIIDKVLPAGLRLVDFVGSRIVPGMKNVWSSLTAKIPEGTFDKVVDFFWGVVQSVTGIFSSIDFSMFSPIVDGAMSLFNALAPLVPQVLQVMAAFNPLSLILKAVAPLLPKIASLLADAIGGALEMLGPILAQIVPLFGEVASVVMGVLGQAFVALLPLVEFLLQTVMQLIPVFLQLIPPVLSIVQALLPLVGVVGNLVMQLLPPLIEVLMAVLPPILALINPLVEALAPVLELVGSLVGEVLVPVIEMLAEILAAVLKALLPVVSLLLEGLVWVLKLVITWVSKLVTGLADFGKKAVGVFKDWVTKVKDNVERVKGFFQELPGKIASFFRDLSSKITRPFKVAFNMVSEAWNKTVGKLEWQVPTWVPKIGGKTVAAPKLPILSLATGGIAFKPVLAQVGDANVPEVVSPIDKLGAMLRPYLFDVARQGGARGRSGPTVVNLTVVDKDGTLLARMEGVVDDKLDEYDDDRSSALTAGGR